MSYWDLKKVMEHWIDGALLKFSINQLIHDIILHFMTFLKK